MLQVVNQLPLVGLLIACPDGSVGKTTVNRHIACWPDGLRTLAALGTNTGLGGGFSARLD